MFAQLVHFYTKQTCRCQAGLCCAGLGGVINQTLDPRQVKLEAGHDTKIT